MATLVLSALFALALAALIGAALKLLRRPGPGEAVGAQDFGEKRGKEPESDSPPDGGTSPSRDIPSSR